MANKNVIVVKKPGEIIHPNYLGHVVKQYTTYFGTALVHDGNLVIHHQKGKWTVENVMKLQSADEVKPKQVIFCFGENPQILDEDMMPFDVIVDKDADKHVALFMEGNFQGYSVPKSTHTNEFHCKEDALQLKLKKLYKGAGSMEAFLAELNDPVTQQDLANFWADRGFISLLTEEGPAATVFNKGNLTKGDYNWGMTSNTLGYVEKTEAKEEPKAEVKELSVLDKLKLKMAGQKEPEKPADLPADKPSETAIAALFNEDEFETVGPAPEKDVGGAVMTNKMKSAWWQNEVGYQPEGYKLATCRVKRKKGTKVGVLAPLAATNVSSAQQNAKPNGTGPQPVVHDAATAMKVDPTTLPDKKPPPENGSDLSLKHVSTDNLPQISPRQKLALSKNWMKDAEIVKVLGDDFQKMAQDPKLLKTYEDIYATFYDGLGLPHTLFLTMEALEKLGKEDLKALCVYAFNRQNDAARAKIELNSILLNPNNKIADRKVAM